MSVSDNSTLAVFRDNEGSYPPLAGGHYGVGDLPVNSYDASPYTDTSIVSLEVGSTQCRYRVHRSILSQSRELTAKPALTLWGEKTNDTISLPELDETTAHTLVHYLYTGRYQTLGAYDLSSESDMIARYKLSTCVYCAAVRYELSGLAQLAKESIMSFGEDLTILDILAIARDNAFPLLPEDETWFSSYLESAIKTSVANDPLLFTKPGFADQIEGDRRFRQVMVKAIVNSYSHGPMTSSTPSVAPSIPEPIEESHTIVETADTAAPAPTAAEKVTPPTVVQATELKSEPMVQTVSNGPVKLDEIEPMLEEPILTTPEPFTDELGSYNSKTYQSIGNKKTQDIAIAPGSNDSNVLKEEAVAAVAAVPAKAETASAQSESIPASSDTVTEKPTHTRNDSVMEIEKTDSIPSATVQNPAAVASEIKEAPASPPVVNGTIGNASAAKKKKGKKGKKNAGTTF